MLKPPTSDALEKVSVFRLQLNCCIQDEIWMSEFLQALFFGQTCVSDRRESRWSWGLRVTFLSRCSGCALLLDRCGATLCIRTIASRLLVLEVCPAILWCYGSECQQIAVELLHLEWELNLRNCAKPCLFFGSADVSRRRKDGARLWDGVRHRRFSLESSSKCVRGGTEVSRSHVYLGAQAALC